MGYKSFAAPPTAISATDYAQSYDFMKGLGCVSGLPDGQPHLDEPMTRAQAVTILVNCTGQANNAKPLAGAPAFPDTDNHWASGAVALAKSKAWVNGFPDGKFHPEEKVTYGQLAQMVGNAVGLQNAILDWPDRAIQAAIDAGFMSADAFSNANSNIPRGSVFYYANNYFLNVALANGKTIYQQNFGVNPTPPPTPPTAPLTTPPTRPPTPPTTGSNGSSSSSHRPPTLSINDALTVIGDTYAQISLQTTDVYTSYYVVLPANAVAPTDYQVSLGMDSDWHPASNQGSSQQALINVQNLIGNTAYSVYVVGDNGHRKLTMQRKDFTTQPTNASSLTVSSFVYGLTPNVQQGVQGFSLDFTVSYTNATKLYYIFPISHRVTRLRMLKRGYLYIQDWKFYFQQAIQRLQEIRLCSI